MAKKYFESGENLPYAVALYFPERRVFKQAITYVAMVIEAMMIKKRGEASEATTGPGKYNLDKFAESLVDIMHEANLYVPPDVLVAYAAWTCALTDIHGLVTEIQDTILAGNEDFF